LRILRNEAYVWYAAVTKDTRNADIGRFTTPSRLRGHQTRNRAVRYANRITKEQNVPPVVSIVGKSESGKTTLIEKLIPRLKQRGLRIGIVKHAHHGFDMDDEGKDSHRYRQAGADASVVAGPRHMAMIRELPGDRLEDLLPFFDNVDLLITEGFKRESAPKIEVFRAERHRHPACTSDATLIAMISDTPLTLDVPRFSTGAIDAIADFIIKRFLPGR
jgi:molybdopterin-guanine dinucleotide biosynthesis adapter protein